ncbi:hypothetical protein B0H63DRAFT_524802 [Podospora didyma]|uniref:Uncharacterized protein n=1 Tax=Podospora didyma TaxID=330526 RepID=A0AAE0KIW9_9PEZI|nr:hypothetical protein B0H63DRAFT_524802 [Podospora didyma]
MATNTPEPTPPPDSAGSAISLGGDTGLRKRPNAICSRNGIAEILDVIEQLSAAEIASCVVGANALRYYGAERGQDEWELCVLDEQLEAARLIFTQQTPVSTPATAPVPTPAPSPAMDDEKEVETPDPIPDTETSRKYEPATLASYPTPGSLRHTFPSFHLRGYVFYFTLIPSSDSFIDPTSWEHVEKSKTGVPYASLIPFARSLLVQREASDIAQLIDGMHLNIAWGRENLNLRDLKAESFKFDEGRAVKLRLHGCKVSFAPDKEVDEIWLKEAGDEARQKRMAGGGGGGSGGKKGRFLTRWRAPKREPEDPRHKDRDDV